MGGGGGPQRRLGRGIEALLGPSTVEEAEKEGLLRELAVADIRPNRRWGAPPLIRTPRSPGFAPPQLPQRQSDLRCGV